jgi:hypothetical protein
MERKMLKRNRGGKMASVFCQYCKVKDEKNLMKRGITKTGYIHNTCIPRWEKDQEYKKIENEQWSSLYEYLRSLHNALDIPPRNIKRLREIKENKNISYKLMIDAYKVAEDKIKWFIREVLQDGNNAEDINKVITVMMNSGLNQAAREEQMRKRQQQEKEKLMAQETSNDMSHDNLINKKNTKDILDISEFL